MSQAQTLQLIFDQMVRIYDKLCVIEELLQGGDGIEIEVPPFFDAQGSLILDGVIQAANGGTSEDQQFTDRLTGVFQGILQALDDYVENPDIEWEEPT